MTHPTDEATRALIAAEVAELLDARLTGPVRTLLGDDLAEQVRARVWVRAKVIAADLLGDRCLAAQTVTDMAGVLPEQPEPAWWRTPLGQIVGRTYDPEESVTIIRAATLLGVSRARIYQLIDAGGLRRVPGGVALSSVLDRLGGLDGTPIVTRVEISPGSRQCKFDAEGHRCGNMTQRVSVISWSGGPEVRIADCGRHESPHGGTRTK